MIAPSQRQVEVIHQMAAFEQQLHLELPREYKAAVLGGGLPKFRHWMFEFVGIDECDNETNIDAFLTFDPDSDNVPATYEFYTSSGRLPAHVVPIATCIDGNLICINLLTDQRGTICYWDHEFEAGRDCTAKLALLAPDFTSFLQMLRPDN